jgi:hypothetical protein
VDGLLMASGFSRKSAAAGGVRVADRVKRPVRMNARTSGQTSAKRV